MGNLFHELKRRKVFRVAAVYAIVAWLIIQVAGEILPTFDAPQWVNQTIVLVLILGFPLALVLSWAFDITPEGIRSDSAAIHLETAEHATDRKLTYAILVLVLLVAGFQVSDQFLLGGSESREVSPQGPENSGSVQIIRSDLYLGDIERRVIVAMRDDVAMSPDGTLLAYTGQIDGNISVYVRDLTSTDSPTLVAGEAQNFYPIAPVFSPSGENILFTRFLFNEIHSVSADGSRTQLITELAHTSVGANWFSDEEIVFTHNVERNLHTVPIVGGDSEALPIPKTADEELFWPEVLPNEQWLIYTVVSPNPGNFYEGRIDAFNLTTKETKTLVERAFNARFANSEHILFMRDGDLWAAPFDQLLAELQGSEVRIEENIEHYSRNFGKASYSFSEQGRMVYQQGIDAAFSATGEIVLQDMQGEPQAHSLPPNAYRLRFSPDSRQIKFTLANPVGGINAGDIAIYDISDQTWARRTFDGRSTNAIWTPDGRQLLTVRRDDQQWNVWALNADGSGQPEQILSSTEGLRLASVSPDGTKISFSQGTMGLTQIKLLSIVDTEVPIRNLISPGTEQFDGMISPDGRWIAYISDQTGAHEIFIRPFPNLDDGQWQVTYQTGLEPNWGPESNSLYFIQASDTSIYKVDLNTESGVRVGRPELVVEDISWSNQRNPNYSVSPDGSMILFRSRTNEDIVFTAQPTSLVLIENWFEKLKQLAPPDPQ